MILEQEKLIDRLQRRNSDLIVKWLVKLSCNS